jgi:hypothetical protein
MEQLQIAYVSAVAASSGCVLAKPEIDEGIDLSVTHTHAAHSALNDRVARLEIQLKATHSSLPKGAASISAEMRRDRWEYYNVVAPTVHKIVVIMKMPDDPAYWTATSTKALAVRHCAYWVNIAGLPDGGAHRPTVAAPLSQVFDDIALCSMMERIGKGQAP